jgi:DNA replication protein DnaC
MTLKSDQSICNCGGTGYIHNEHDGYSYVKACRCLMWRAKAKNFGELFQDKTIQNYEERSEYMRIAKQKILNDPDKSYFIYGQVGLGKTHLLAGIFELLYESGEWANTRVFTETQLSEEIKKGLNIFHDHLIQVVILDDIGKIKLADWEREKMFNFYNDIYRYNIQLLISSNYALQEISDIYGGAIGRRIEERCELIEIK